MQSYKQQLNEFMESFVFEVVRGLGLEFGTWALFKIPRSAPDGGDHKNGPSLYSYLS